MANAATASLRQYQLGKGKPKPYWLQGLAMVIFTAFLGGSVAPLLLGRPTLIASNEFVIPACVIAWYSIHYLGFHYLFALAPIKVLHAIFLALFRTHTVCNTVSLATTILKANNASNVPVVGPIVVGTIQGCLSLFFPLDRGLAIISQGTPWPLQGALITAGYFQFMVNDVEGLGGTLFRGIFGAHSESAVRIQIFTMHLVTLLLQAFISPESNIFTPLHKVLYLVFQVQGPAVMVHPGKAPAEVGWPKQARERLDDLLLFIKFVFLTSLAFVVIEKYF